MGAFLPTTKAAKPISRRAPERYVKLSKPQFTELYSGEDARVSVIGHSLPGRHTKAQARSGNSGWLREGKHASRSMNLYPPLQQSLN